MSSKGANPNGVTVNALKPFFIETIMPQMSIINIEKLMKMVAIFNVFAFLFNSSVDSSVSGCGFIY